MPERHLAAEVEGNSIVSEATALPLITLLIVDIDNTLFDWFSFWYHSFRAMVGAVLQRVNVDRTVLLKEIREVHQRHKTTEYSWILEELPSIAILPQPRREEVIRAGQRAFREERQRTEHLYPDVYSTLSYVRKKGAKVVGFTESQRFYTIQRLNRFKLDGILDALYCAKEHCAPRDIDLAKERSKPDDAYLLKHTHVVELRTDIRKPNPQVLLNIVAALRGSAHETLYVGDSKMKDVFMAQAAGVHDAYAAYGDSMNKEGYDLLRAVSSWSSKEIATEKIMAVEVSPTVVLQHGLAEITRYFDFGKSTVLNRQPGEHRPFKDTKTE